MKHRLLNEEDNSMLDANKYWLPAVILHSNFLLIELQFYSVTSWPIVRDKPWMTMSVLASEFSLTDP